MCFRRRRKKKQRHDPIAWTRLIFFIFEDRPPSSENDFPTNEGRHFRRYFVHFLNELKYNTFPFLCNRPPELFNKHNLERESIHFGDCWCETTVAKWLFIYKPPQPWSGFSLPPGGAEEMTSLISSGTVCTESSRTKSRWSSDLN